MNVSPERFFSHVEKTSDCWKWVGAKNNDGYGNVNCGGTFHKAHRVSWFLHFGDIPFGMNILHKCDNPSCVRPSHLFVGSQTDNMRDCARKGRKACGDRHPFRIDRTLVARGERAGKAKLKESEVLEIRNLYRPYSREFSTPCLAKKYGVNTKSIHDIVTRKSWSHI